MPDRLLTDNIAQQVKSSLEKGLREPVQVIFFGQEEDCHYCADTLQLVGEVIELSDKLELQTYDLEKNADLARHYNVTKAPGLVIAGKDGDQVLDYGIRFAGIPAGYEFSSLIQSLILVSSRDSGLNARTRQMLRDLTKPVDLLVFATPT